MSGFNSPLILQDNDGDVFTVVQTFEYRVGSLDNDIKITVPAGFKTDFSSIPRWLSIVLPKLGRQNKASVIHDYLYQKTREGKFSRVVADGIFNEAMSVSGVHPFKRWIIYLAVRLFGFCAIKFSKPMNEVIAQENVAKGII